ncbi:MAG: hypothetical protein ACE1Z1_03605 [Candidatus Acidiferrales bacterium]
MIGNAKSSRQDIPPPHLGQQLCQEETARLGPNPSHHAVVVKALQCRKFRIADLEVRVEPVVMQLEEGTTAFRVVGLCGKSGCVEMMTVEPDAKATRAGIEKALQSFCESIARETAGREKVRQLAEKLV